MKVYITITPKVIATWHNYTGPIPEMRDLIFIDRETYMVRRRMFTEKDVRLEVELLEPKVEFDSIIRDFHQSL